MCKVLSFLKRTSSSSGGHEREGEKGGEEKRERETFESSFNALNGTFDDFMNNKPLTTINFCIANR